MSSRHPPDGIRKGARPAVGGALNARGCHLSQRDDRPGRRASRDRLARAGAHLPSVNFLLLLLIFSGTGSALWNGVVGGRFPVVVLVLSGWTISLCLHEFAHALTAYLGGDAAIARTGYLDLDPTRYTNPALSIILPVVFVLLGGFGLPGAAIYVRTGALRSRGWKVAVAAAGPAANLAVLALLAALYQALPRDGADGTASGGLATDLASGLAVLALFQATAIVLNLLPAPGLDGFGVLRPFLNPRTAAKAEQVGAGAFLVLFLLILLTPIGNALIRLGANITLAFGFDLEAIARGFGMMRLL